MNINLSTIFQRGLELLLFGSISMGVAALKDVSTSINELNVKIGVMVERTDGMQKRLDIQDDRIHLLELNNKK